jgi:two-component system chemotaxis response regulator CheY
MILGPTVLLVDDDAFVRTVLRDALQEDGYNLLEAEDGEQALELIREHRPSVVLLDLFMPRKSGLEALGEITATAPECKVLVISSLDTEALVEQALRSGAAGFITKPFHPLEISSEVKRQLTH